MIRITVPYCPTIIAIDNSRFFIPRIFPCSCMLSYCIRLVIGDRNAVAVTATGCVENTTRWLSHKEFLSVSVPGMFVDSSMYYPEINYGPFG